MPSALVFLASKAEQSNKELCLRNNERMALECFVGASDVTVVAHDATVGRAIVVGAYHVCRHDLAKPSRTRDVHALLHCVNQGVKASDRLGFVDINFRADCLIKALLSRIEIRADAASSLS